MQGASTQPATARPLCVDLDGSLIQTDSLVESALHLIRRNVLNVLRMLLWLLRGKAELKHQIAIRSRLEVALLPYHQELLAYLREQQGQREIYLVTGSHETTANAIAEHLALFTAVIASNQSRNLIGPAKRDELVQRFGEQGYDYIGDSKADWPVWEAAQDSMLVAGDSRFARTSRARFQFSREFSKARLGFRGFAKAIRVHQWTKNLLIFIPLLLEHRLFDWSALLALAACFASMSLFASATYLVNDLFDLDSDRQNSTKRHRALAAGRLSPQNAIITIGALLLATALLATTLPTVFVFVLLLYGVTTLAYSLVLKKIMIVDVCVLAALFTLRIIGGGLVVQLEVSFWLLAFSMFFFLSLALGKRVSELTNAHKEKRLVQGRGYLPQDLQMLISAGTSSGFMSVLVVAMYINSDKVAQLYSAPEILWLICPLLLYWIGRFWFIVARGGMHEDPIIFALGDRTSLLTVALGATIVLCAAVMSGIL